MSPSRALLATIEADVRPRGGVLRVEAVRRGVLEDSVLGARLELGDGTALVAPEARVLRRALGAPEVRVPSARVELHRDPVSAYSGLQALRGALPAGVFVERVSVAYEHRAVGKLAMDGVRRQGTEPGSFTAERVQLGHLTWSNAAFSVTAKKQALVVLLGSHATARYLASDGRAGEWLIQVPRQPFGQDPARITGTFSWIVPEDPAVAARGSFRVVLDHWPGPGWPEAGALLGSSGSIAAGIAPTSDATTLRLERLKVETAHFPLDGSGTVTLAERPRIELEARGRRACAELAQVLPSSRYRDVIRAHPALEGESVELSVRLEVATSDGLAPRFEWRLSAGCGLAAL